MDALTEAGIQVIDTGDLAPSEDALISLAHDVDALLVTLAPVSAKVIEAAARVKVITKVGAGVDNIDMTPRAAAASRCATRREATRSPLQTTRSGMLLALARDLLHVDRQTRAGLGWSPWPVVIGEELAGKAIGIIGYGLAGRAVARRARGFGMRVLAYDVRAGELDGSGDTEFIAMDDVLRASDFVSVHVPLSDRPAISSARVSLIS